MNEQAKQLGLNLGTEEIRSAAFRLEARYPDLKQALNGAANRQDVAAVLANLPQNAVEGALKMEHEIQTAWTEGLAQVYSEISKAAGLSEDEVRSRLDMRDITPGGKFDYLRKDLRDLYDDAAKTPDGSIPAEQIRTGFQNIVTRFLTGKIGLYKSIDGLHLSPELTAKWKNEVLTNPTLKTANFLTRCTAIAERMNAGSLRTALAAGNLSAEEMFGLFHSIGAQLDECAHAEFTAQEYNDMGSDEVAAINRFVREAFLERNPDIREAMRAQSDLMKAAFRHGEEMTAELQRRLSSFESYESPEARALYMDFSLATIGLGVISGVVNVEE